MMDHEEILHRCFRCGYCKLPGSFLDLNCPAYLRFRFETYSPGGRMWLLRALLREELNATPRLGEILFSCATCGNCVEHCAFRKFRDHILDAFIAGRNVLVEAGRVPRGVRDYLKAIHEGGNPWGLPREDRGRWADGLGLERYDGQDYLLLVGDVGAYDERGRKMARCLARVLTKRGVSFGILENDERTDGNEVHALGEWDLFELLARDNIAMWQDLGVKRIVTLSPHAYNAVRRLYPTLGGDYDVCHYTQLLAEKKPGDKRSSGAPPIRVTYHDPCYLGRHNEEYKAPRSVLKKLPGVRLVEMDRAQKDALCCGGGGGNFFTDVLRGGPDAPSRVRVREAQATGAEVLVVACPQCAKMLDDAVKAEDMEDRLSVMDVAEVVESRYA